MNPRTLLLSFFLLLICESFAQSDQHTIYGTWETLERRDLDGTLLYSSDSILQQQILERMLVKEMARPDSLHPTSMELTRQTYEDHLYRVGETTYTFTTEDVLTIQYSDFDVRWTFQIDTIKHQLLMTDPVFGRTTPVSFHIEGDLLTVEGFPAHPFLLLRRTL